jgi:DNA polymerase-3 subunit beta
MQVVVKKDLFGVKLSKLSKFAGDGKAIPVYAYFLLNVKENNEMEITAGDGNTYITDTYSLITTQEPGATCVSARELSKLVDSLSNKEELTLALVDNKLVVTSGRGKWKLETIPAEQYPSYLPDAEAGDGLDLDLKELQTYLRCAKVCVAKDMTNPYLTGYRIGNEIFTSDVLKLFVSTKQFGGQKLAEQGGMLIGGACVDALLYDTDTKKVKVRKIGNQALFNGDSFRVVSTLVDGIEKFPNADPFVMQSMEHKVKINRQTLIPILNRACIFTTLDLSNAVKLTFKNNEMVVSSFNTKDSGGSNEAIDINYSGAEFSILIDGNDLINLMNGLVNDEFEIYAEPDTINIKIVQEGIVYILCTLDFNNGEESK